MASSSAWPLQDVDATAPGFQRVQQRAGSHTIATGDDVADMGAVATARGGVGRRESDQDPE